MSTAPRTSGLAIASLLCGVFGFTCIATVPGLICGAIALVRINASGGSQKGFGMALTGMILSGLCMLATPIVLACSLLYIRRSASEAPSVETMEAMDRKNETQLGFTLLNYHRMYGEFPEGTSKDAKEFPVERRLSWIASTLPLLDRQALYDRLAFDEAWDGATNAPATATPIVRLQNPSLSLDPSSNLTHYVGMAGIGPHAARLPAKDPKAGIFGYDRATKIRDVRDGSANTMMVIGVSEHLGPWAQGGPSTIRGLDAEPYIGGPDGFGGGPDGVHVLMADGSVRLVNQNVDPKVFEAMATKAGGEGRSPFDLP